MDCTKSGSCCMRQRGSLNEQQNNQDLSAHILIAIFMSDICLRHANLVTAKSRDINVQL